MSVSYEVDLKEVLGQINQKLDRNDEKLDRIQRDFDQKLDTLQKDVTDLKVGVARLEEKVDGLSKRVDSQEFISRGILIGLMVAILGGLAKLFGFAGNP